MKKFITFFILFFIIFGTNIHALDEFKTIKASELPEKFDKENLLKFEDEKSATQFIKDQRRSKKVYSKIYNKNPFLAQSKRAYGHKMNVLTSWVTARLELSVDYFFVWGSRQRQNIFSQLKGMHVAIDGVAPGQEWELNPRASWGDIQNDGKKLFCSVNGTYRWYLIIKGTIKLQEKNEHYKSNFLSPGRHNW